MNRPQGRQRDPDYLSRVRGLPCAMRLVSACQGRIEADHVGQRPMGRKCDDREAIPLCTRHHRERHAWAGPFREWTGDQMREWKAAMIRRTQEALDAPVGEWLA